MPHAVRLPDGSGDLAPLTDERSGDDNTLCFTIDTGSDPDSDPARRTSSLPKTLQRRNASSPRGNEGPPRETPRRRKGRDREGRVRAPQVTRAQERGAPRPLRKASRGKDCRAQDIARMEAGSSREEKAGGKWRQRDQTVADR